VRGSNRYFLPSVAKVAFPEKALLSQAAPALATGCS
jgi:hypothetical protein